MSIFTAGIEMGKADIFEELIAEIIESKFGLALRHDVRNELGRSQRGWTGLGIRDLEPVSAVLTAN
jgi:hypothetical protein